MSGSVLMVWRAVSIVAGFVLACMAFGLVLAAFVFTPAEFATLPAGQTGARLSMAWAQALLSATQVAMFAGLPALIAALVAEWRRIDDWRYYSIVALLIAVLGFLAQYASEPQGAPTIGNNYAAAAFLTGGLVSGLVYWILAGRYAGTRSIASSPASATSATEQA